jgi:hypothetical protein
MRNCDYYIMKARELGTHCGSYTEELLQEIFPGAGSDRRRSSYGGLLNDTGQNASKRPAAVRCLSASLMYIDLSVSSSRPSTEKHRVGKEVIKKELFCRLVLDDRQSILTKQRRRNKKHYGRNQ